MHAHASASPARPKPLQPHRSPHQMIRALLWKLLSASASGAYRTIVDEQKPPAPPKATTTAKPEMPEPLPPEPYISDLFDTSQNPSPFRIAVGTTEEFFYHLGTDNPPKRTKWEQIHEGPTTTDEVERILRKCADDFFGESEHSIGRELSFRIQIGPWVLQCKPDGAHPKSILFKSCQSTFLSSDSI